MTRFPFKARFSLASLFVLVTVAAVCVYFAISTRDGNAVFRVQSTENNPNAEILADAVADKAIILNAIFRVPARRLPAALRNANKAERIEWFRRHMTVTTSPDRKEALITITSATGTRAQHERLADAVTAACAKFYDSAYVFHKPPEPEPPGQWRWFSRRVIDYDDPSPEDACRIYRIAIGSGDLETLKSITLPSEDLAILLNDESGFDDVEKAKKNITAVGMARYTDSGDPIFAYEKHADSKVFEIKRMDSHLRVFHPPTRVVLTDDGWKVDPTWPIRFRQLESQGANEQGKDSNGGP